MQRCCYFIITVIAMTVYHDIVSQYHLSPRSFHSTYLFFNSFFYLCLMQQFTFQMHLTIYLENVKKNIWIKSVKLSVFIIFFYINISFTSVSHIFRFYWRHNVAGKIKWFYWNAVTTVYFFLSFILYLWLFFIWLGK